LHGVGLFEPKLDALAEHLEFGIREPAYVAFAWQRVPSLLFDFGRPNRAEPGFVQGGSKHDHSIAGVVNHRDAFFGLSEWHDEFPKGLATISGSLPEGLCCTENSAAPDIW